VAPELLVAPEHSGKKPNEIIVSGGAECAGAIGRWVGKAHLRRAHHRNSRRCKKMVGTRSLSSGAHSRDPLALPT